MSYDLKEASEILERFVQLQDPSHFVDAKAQAGLNLLNALLDIKVPGVSAHVISRTNGVGLHVDRRVIQVKVLSDGEVVVADENGVTPIPLLLDRASGKLVGVELDDQRAPAPGERKPHRDGLAVTMEYVVERLRHRADAET